MILEAYDIKQQFSRKRTEKTQGVNYVAGFLFRKYHDRKLLEGDLPLDEVCLILKDKPIQQQGKLNGVGGKIEMGENAYDAMDREFQEECGCRVMNWQPFYILSGPGWRVFFFRSIEELHPHQQVKQMENEKPDWYEVSMIKDNFHQCVENLEWLLPMATMNEVQIGCSFTDIYPE